MKVKFTHTRRHAIRSILALVTLSLASPASAAINIRVEEVGANVTLAYEGSIDGSLGTPDRVLTSGESSIYPSEGRFLSNDRSSLDFYFEPFATNLPNFGTGTETISASIGGTVTGSGDRFGLTTLNTNGRSYTSLVFDQNFSGGSLSGLIVISDSSFDSLGIDPDFGTFTTTYDFADQGGTATGAFNFTVVPEPSAYAGLLGLATLALAGLRRRRG